MNEEELSKRIDYIIEKERTMNRYGFSEETFKDLKEIILFLKKHNPHLKYDFKLYLLLLVDFPQLLEPLVALFKTLIKLNLKPEQK